MAVRAEVRLARLARGPLSLVGTTRVLLERLRSDGPVVLAALAVVGFASFVVAAVPRALNEMADEGLRHEVARASALERDVEILRAGRIPAGLEDEPLARVAARGEELAGLLGAVEAVVGERTAVVDSPRYSLQAGAPLPGTTRYVTLRQASGLDGHVRAVEGRLPEPTVGSARVDVVGRIDRARVFEVAFSRTAAQLLAVEVGDRLVFTSDAGDPLIRGVALEERSPLVLRVTGLWEPRERGSHLWSAQAQLNEPLVEETPGGDHRFVYAYALYAANAYGALTDAVHPMPLQYTWRYAVEPAAFDGARLPALETDLRRLDARYGRFVRPAETYVRTSLPAVLDRYERRRELATTLLATVEIGLLAAALAVVGLLASLVVDRRREAIALTRSRGASALQVLAAQAAEALLLAAPVALLAYLAATLVDGRAGPFPAWSVAGIVVATAVLFVALAAGPAARAVPLEVREDAAARLPSPRRLVLEGLVVALSLVGVHLLRRRGLAGGAAAGPDPYLAAVPVLLAFAAGMVALRVYPLPLAGVARLAARRRDLVAALGTRRVARRPSATGIPLLVTVLAVSVAVFAAVEARTISHGHAEVAWERVGADYRVDVRGDAAEPAAAAAVAREGEAVARAWVDEDARVVTGGAGTLGGLTVLALDAEAYAEVVAGTPAGEPLPFGRGRDGAVPAVLTGRPVQGAAVVPGEPFTVQSQQRELTLVAVERRERVAGAGAGGPVAVVPLERVRAGLGESLVRPNRLYVRAGPAAGAALRRALPAASVVSRRDVERSLRDSPLVAGTLDGFRAAALLGGILAGLAVVLAATLAARARAREVVYLRALGLSSRQALGVAALELVPSTLVALAIGVGLGLAIPHLVAPGIDLTAFTGAAPVITRDLTAVGLLAGAVLAVLAAAVAAAGAAARRAQLGRALRAEQR
ncbi:MAG TPA: FtsX-like permease family protein [Gaiellaceae bacterium]|nr:FtsX-like permease family protein [Gaiellaceae bacterium]